LFAPVVAGIQILIWKAKNVLMSQMIGANNL